MNHLLAIPESPLRPVLDPGIFVEARDSLTQSEYDRQRSLIAALAKTAPKVFIFAVPNATQSQWSKLRQQREGAVYGAVDLICTWPDISNRGDRPGIAFIEMKDGTGKPAVKQIEFMNRLARQGHPVAVIRTAAGGISWLRRQGAPVPLLS